MVIMVVLEGGHLDIILIVLKEVVKVFSIIIIVLPINIVKLLNMVIQVVLVQMHIIQVVVVALGM